VGNAGAEQLDVEAARFGCLPRFVRALIDAIDT
jgi:hypothetical protein